MNGKDGIENSRNRANIKVSREFYEEHNERRKELGQTWQEYIAGNAPELQIKANVDEDEIADTVAAKLLDDLLAQLPTRIADELR